MRVDVHAHCWTNDYLDLLAAGTGKARMGAASYFGKPQADADLSHTSNATKSNSTLGPGE
jgi:hypothetical protein